jgi:hypothetical protein
MEGEGEGNDSKEEGERVRGVTNPHTFLLRKSCKRLPFNMGNQIPFLCVSVLCPPCALIVCATQPCPIFWSAALSRRSGEEESCCFVTTCLLFCLHIYAAMRFWT